MKSTLQHMVFTLSIAQSPSFDMNVSTILRFFMHAHYHSALDGATQHVVSFFFVYCRTNLEMHTCSKAVIFVYFIASSYSSSCNVIGASLLRLQMSKIDCIISFVCYSVSFSIKFNKGFSTVKCAVGDYIFHVFIL